MTVLCATVLALGETWTVRPPPAPTQHHDTVEWQQTLTFYPRSVLIFHSPRSTHRMHAEAASRRSCTKATANLPQLRAVTWTGGRSRSPFRFVYICCR